jgi:hypothetical protein
MLKKLSEDVHEIKVELKKSSNEGQENSFSPQVLDVSPFTLSLKVFYTIIFIFIKIYKLSFF